MRTKTPTPTPTPTPTKPIFPEFDFTEDARKFVREHDFSPSTCNHQLDPGDKASKTRIEFLVARAMEQGAERGLAYAIIRLRGFNSDLKKMAPTLPEEPRA